MLNYKGHPCSPKNFAFGPFLHNILFIQCILESHSVFESNTAVSEKHHRERVTDGVKVLKLIKYVMLEDGNLLTVSAKL